MFLWGIKAHGRMSSTVGFLEWLSSPKKNSSIYGKMFLTNYKGNGHVR